MQSWWSLQFEDVCANSLWHLCSLVTRNKVILAKPFLLCTMLAQFVKQHFKGSRGCQRLFETVLVQDAEVEKN